MSRQTLSEPEHYSDNPRNPGDDRHMLEEHLQLACMRLDKQGHLYASLTAQELLGLATEQSVSSFLTVLEPAEIHPLIGKLEIDGSAVAIPDASGLLTRAKLWQYLSAETDDWELVIQLDGASENQSNPLSRRYFAQQQLLSIISHEIRTPAATLRMLIDELSSGSDLEKHLPLLQQTSEHLMAVLQDMRQAINPEQNLPFAVRRFHPNRLLESVVSQMRRMAQERGMSIRMQLLADESTLIETDLERCKIVLLNLIKNAICHSEGREIAVLTQLKQGSTGRAELYVAVQDDGIGISQSQLDRLTQPFEQLQMMEKGGSGAGLGLFVVKQTVSELNAQVKFGKGPANCGLQVECTIPCETFEVGATAYITIQQESQAFQDRLGQMRVLVVEDDPVIRMVSQRLLAKRVALVDVAENGEAGLQKILSNDYDLILSDYFMPVMDGAEMIRQTRERGITTPILSVTAAVLGSESQELLNAGANKILAKPISMKAFIDAVESL